MEAVGAAQSGFVTVRPYDGGMSRGRYVRAAAPALLAVALLLTACSSAGDASSSSTAPSSSGSPAPCPVGQSTQPPNVSALTANDVPIEKVTNPLYVPFRGLNGGTDLKPSVLRVEVFTDTSGSPVTFRATGAQLVETLETAQSTAPGELTVFSKPGTGNCVAVVYLFSTRIGPATITAAGANTLSGNLTVVTSPEAARNIALRVSSPQVTAGETVQALLDVTDVFGNPVENAPVDLTLPAKGPGRFATGANTFTVSTDPKGKASVDIATVADKGGALAVRAKGDLASCLPLQNQYACRENQPVEGFAKSSGPQEQQVTVVSPSVRVTSPAPGSAFSAGQKFSVTAQATGVKEGATARLLLAGFPVGASVVKSDGSVEFKDVVAQIPQSGDLGYQLAIDTLKVQSLDISVKHFGIVSYKKVRDGLKFRVTPGAWPRGTIIELTRDGNAVGRIELQDPGVDVYLFAPEAPGIYQVQVRTAQGYVYGEVPQPVA